MGLRDLRELDLFFFVMAAPAFAAGPASGSAAGSCTSVWGDTQREPVRDLLNDVHEHELLDLGVNLLDVFSG